jgi:tetratricopeptide (TPR) repeat protein
LTSGHDGADPRWVARAWYEAGAYQQALTAFSAMLARDSTDLEAMGRIATASSRLGDRATAKRIDDRLRVMKGPYLMGAPLRWRAAIAATQGRTDEAVALLETAVRQGHRLMDTPPNLTVHLDADFVGIEKTPAYRAMLQALAEASSAK